MKLLYLILLTYPLNLFSQVKAIYVKFESNKDPKMVSAYICGQKNVFIQSVSTCTDIFFPIRLYECKPVQILLDGYEAKLFPTKSFLCGDSIIANTDNGYSKIINRKYVDYEQNYYFYRAEFFQKNHYEPDNYSWKGLHETYNLEKQFLEEIHAKKYVSDSFYTNSIIDLPYKINNYILRASFVNTIVTKDSLITCKWYSDSLINTENYIDYVTGYIHYFEIKGLPNGAERESTFLNYVYTNTSGQLREKLFFLGLVSSNFVSNKEHLKQFEIFKNISRDKDLIHTLEEKIETAKKQANKQ